MVAPDAISVKQIVGAIYEGAKAASRNNIFGVKIKSTLGFLSKGNVVKVTAASAVRPEGGSASLARATELVERFIAEAKPLASSTGLAKSEGFVATTLEPREAPP